MNSFINWIGAQAEEGGGKDGQPFRMGVQGESAKTNVPCKNLAEHGFPAWRNRIEIEPQDDPLERNPNLWLYRDRTVALLRRYVRFSLETGRLPSLVGREFFRARITAYPSASFEDRIIFVRDVEACLKRLEYWDQQLIARVILQEHSHDKAAYLLHCSRKTVQRRVVEVIDLLSEDFLRVELLTAQEGEA